MKSAIDGKCTECGNSDFYLSEDHTIYTRVEWDDENEEWIRHSSPDFELSAADDAIRFYCIHCGSLHNVPINI